MRNDFESNYLMHHGILGMKWGIRRYQNPDGSLTAAGRERYGVKEGGSVNDISTEQGRKNRAKDLKKAIKKNEKARGRQYSRIANNPENFLGLNKKHAKKIEEYSENIRKGEAEIERLKTKAEANNKVKETAAKTHTFIGNADETFDFLAKNAYDEITGYGNRVGDVKNANKFDKQEMRKTFHDAFGGDKAAQRKALKILYAAECSRFMDEESADPESSQVFRNVKPVSSSSRLSDLATGNSWGEDHADEWRSYMEDNSGTKVDRLTAQEKVEALKESGLYYTAEDLEYIRKYG